MVFLRMALAFIGGLDRRVVAGAIGLAALLGAGWWLYSSGYDDGRAEMRAEIEAQREKAAEAARRTFDEAGNMDRDDRWDALTGGVR